MDQGLMVNVLLGILGVLSYRLLQGIDEATKAISSLNEAVGKLGVMIDNQQKEITEFKQETERRNATSAQMVESVRGRLHDFGNKVQVLWSLYEMTKRGRDE